MAVCTDMASAWWQNVCTLGDTYVEWIVNDPKDCATCTNWCQRTCPTVGGTVVKNPCQGKLCQCCCSKPPPSSPSSPSLPPTPSSASIFTVGDITTSICTAEQKYLTIFHTQGPDCALRPQCESKCKEQGLVSVGSQCAGTSGDGEEKSFQWVEQCCCKEPPPCPCPSCCGSDINIQISVTTGGCKAESSTPSTCGVKSSTPSTTYLSL
ncbi:hypothetical protein MKW94_028860 [Papaver nudicaule]|uniref:4Fe-4S ferredoxin-type domain-containing protein n=1 Tax=Papaver nudicaule TaxID=74823 RepID=A0AA41VE39_PAPNU|nr:hypothetical protein [Papaver nudicaule]